MSLKILVGVTLYYYDWICVSYDVEAAFLTPKMDTKLYIQCPKEMVELGFLMKEQLEKKCILLLNSMYGNVDAALRWIRLKMKFLTSDKVGMEQNQTDRCVFYEKEDGGKPKLILVITVDDCAVGGTREAIEELLDKVESEFNITRGGLLKKHLGADYEWKQDENGKPYVEVK